MVSRQRNSQIKGCNHTIAISHHLQYRNRHERQLEIDVIVGFPCFPDGTSTFGRKHHTMFSIGGECRRFHCLLLRKSHDSRNQYKNQEGAAFLRCAWNTLKIATIIRFQEIVLGIERSWFASLSIVHGVWTESFHQSSCVVLT